MGNTDNATIRAVYVLASNFEIDEKVIDVLEAKTEVMKAVKLAMRKERALRQEEAESRLM